MGKSKLLVALGATAAMVALPLASASMASASTNGSNTGTAVTRSATDHAASPAAIDASFKTFDQPGTRGYLARTCVIDLSAIPDFTIINSVQGCGQTVSFDVGMDKRSVPSSWGSWGSPPDTESATPNILYTSGATTITLSLSQKSRLGGAEAEPNPFEVHAISATYMKNGKVRGTVTRDCDGSAGAKLLAAKMHRKYNKIVYSSDVDFAIAQIRVWNK